MKILSTNQKACIDAFDTANAVAAINELSNSGVKDLLRQGSAGRGITVSSAGLISANEQGINLYHDTGSNANTIVISGEGSDMIYGNRVFVVEPANANTSSSVYIQITSCGMSFRLYIADVSANALTNFIPDGSVTPSVPMIIAIINVGHTPTAVWLNPPADGFSNRMYTDTGIVNLIIIKTAGWEAMRGKVFDILPAVTNTAGEVGLQVKSTTADRPIKIYDKTQHILTTTIPQGAIVAGYPAQIAIVNNGTTDVPILLNPLA